MESGRFSDKVFYINHESDKYLRESNNLDEVTRVILDSQGGEIKNKILTGLHWFHKGQTTLDNTESLLFYFISLESLSLLQAIQQ